MDNEERLWLEYFHILPYLEQADDNVDITWFNTTDNANSKSNRQN